MKAVTVVLVIILLTVSVMAQKSRLNTEYYKVEDRTNVSTRSESVKGTSLYVIFYFNHRGREIEDSPAFIGLVLDSYSSSWKYGGIDPLRLYVLAGEERFNVTGQRGSSRVHSGRYSTSVSERLIFMLTVEQFKTILSTGTVEFQLAQQQFKFSDKTIEGGREMLTLIESVNP